MERIVVGTDGSPGATNAVRWAAAMAASQGAELVVMTGSGAMEADRRSGETGSVLEERARDLEEWSAPARSGDVAVRTVVEPGDPRPGILAVAEREGADLVVVGRVGTSSGPGLLRTGSLVEWLAHHTDRPTAVVGGVVNLVPERVLVAVDGSEGASAAVDWVRELREHAAVHVIAASVHEPVPEWTPANSPDNWRRGVERRIATELAAPLFEAEGDVVACALTSVNVAEALLRAAGDERADLVVIGTRGLGGFSGLRVGGVTMKVVHLADRPLVIVPPA